LDDIKSGLKLFIVADGLSTHHQANLELSHLFGKLNSGKQSMMLTDLEMLKAN
jgi:hypothetical protein